MGRRLGGVGGGPPVLPTFFALCWSDSADPQPSLSHPPPPMGITKIIPGVGRGLGQAYRWQVGTLELSLPAQS